MTDAPLHVDLGTLETLIGSLQLTFVVSGEGDAHLQLYATDPSRAGGAGVLLMLDAAGYERLKTLVREADSTIDRMIAEGRIKRMVLPY
ncbi:MAG TPA: hypothetical protein VGX48_21585 [Pyrinomonadaceae bacterium]|jgi:hypothetical protein|nr:hypothetical protein [Pyrinomonadaceae bacterium]